MFLSITPSKLPFFFLEYLIKLSNFPGHFHEYFVFSIYACVIYFGR